MMPRLSFACHVPTRAVANRSVAPRPCDAKRLVFAALFAALAALAFYTPTLAADAAPAPSPPAAGAAASPPAATALPPGITPVTAVEGIEEFLLASNGLRILLFPDPSKQTATVNITYLVGSRHENYGETGMAHLLEHLLFKGSTNHPKIPDELTSHGSRPNGSTWLDRTNYFETFAATDENLEWALDLEADRMVNSFIAKKDLDSEMSVVRNEFEVGENNPGAILEERVVSTAYLWHNYGNSTIGARSDIENVPIERLQAFYRRWYQPDNAILVVAGRFDRGRALALIAERFGRIPRPERTIPSIYTEEPAQDGERAVTLRRVGDIQVVKLAYHVPAGSHADFAAVEVLGRILGDEPSGRLYKALVETRIATSTSASPMQFRDPGLLILSADLRREGRIETVRDEMIRVAQGLTSQPVTAEEVERAKKALLSDWESAMRNSQWAAVGLSEWAAMGDWRLLFLHRDRLKEVTAAGVQRVAADYLVTNNRTTGMFIPAEKPERVSVPPTPDVAAMLQGYTGGKALAAGEEFDASVEAIERDVVRAELPAGLKLIMLPKKTHAQTVSLVLNLHLGDESSLRGQAYVGRFASSMLMRGTRQHTRQQIEDALDAMKARLRIGGRGDFRGMGTSSADNLRGSGECVSADLPALLRLMAEIVKEPSFPPEEFALLKEEMLRDAEDSKHEPFSLAMTRLQRHLNPWPADDVRYTATPEEQIAGIQAVTAEQAAAFHRDFYGASSGELVLIGDFDPREIEPLLRELLGDWKSARPHRRLASAYREVPALADRIEAPDKESAVMNAGERLELQDSDPEYPALVLANFMTGGGFLNSRLAVRIRQKEGYSYGVGSFFMASAFERSGAFGAFAIYAPQNVEGLDRALREEIERVVRDGFTAEEVAAAKSGWLQQRTVSRSNDRELGGSLASRAYEGRDLRWDAAIEERVAALTPEEIAAAVRRHLDPARLSVVHAGDFAKAKAAGASGEKANAPKGDKESKGEAETRGEKERG